MVRPMKHNKKGLRKTGPMKEGSVKQETKEVVTKSEAPSALALTDNELNDWGGDSMSSKDVLIPKILVMQGLSDLVTEGKATMGEFRDSLTGELLGSITSPLKIIPFHVEKMWDFYLMSDEDKFEWDRSEPLVENPALPGYNDNLEWDGEEGGKKLKRVRRMNFFCIIPSQVEKGNALPYTISFKSTSYREGRKLFSQMFVRNRMAKLPPCAYNIDLAGMREKNDHGTFIVPQYSLGEKITNEEYALCKQWFALIKAGGYKVDDSDVQSEKTVEQAETTYDTTGTGQY